MDRCQYVYRPLAEAPPVSALPVLETEGITFGSRSNLNKLTPAVVALWSQLLHRCPGSRLLLQYSHLADPQWRGWVRGAFSAHGLPPERLLLIDWDPTLQHLAGYRLIDIALDPFPYNGLTTTCDALWMGVPVVVLRGSVPQARAGVSLLEALGRSTWIADTPEQYLAIAEALAADPLRLSAERSSLRALMAASPLRQEAEHARSFERCLDRMLAEPAGVCPRRRRARSARSAQA
jgi:predicted O-linked N-acetylglucosamine transferase (SPINDLY family)